MVRKLVLYIECAVIAAWQVAGIASAIVGLWPASAQTAPTSEAAHPSEAALNDPNIVQDFMAALPPSDPIARDYERYNRWTGRTEISERPDQIPYYRMGRSVSAHRFLTNKGRGRREMKAILLRASAGFAAECKAKGGYLELKNSNFHALTQADIRSNASLGQLDICMKSTSKSLGAFLIQTAKDSYDYDDDAHAIMTLHPRVVVTQVTLDEQATREAAAGLRRQAAWEQERVDVERWRLTIQPGTETGCGPVLSVKGDLIEVAHYQTRAPKWYRRTELSPTRFNGEGLATCR
jgi:hypothetical protein